MHIKCQTHILQHYNKEIHKWKHLQHFEVQKTHSESKLDKTHMKDPRKCNFHINSNNNKKTLVALLAYLPTYKW
jgi:hypothetical protein